MAGKRPIQVEWLPQAGGSDHAMQSGVDRHCDSIRCSLAFSTLPTERCHYAPLPPIEPADTAPTSPKGCGAACAFLHKDHAAAPASVEWSAVSLPTAGRWSLWKDHSLVG